MSGIFCLKKRSILTLYRISIFHSFFFIFERESECNSLGLIIMSDVPIFNKNVQFVTLKSYLLLVLSGMLRDSSRSIMTSTMIRDDILGKEMPLWQMQSRVDYATMHWLRRHKRDVQFKRNFPKCIIFIFFYFLEEGFFSIFKRWSL